MNQLLEIIPLNVSARGEVLSSNLAEFRSSVKAVLDSISRTPQTDVEFGIAEQNVKMLKGAEDAVKAAKEKALKDAESLHAFFKALDESSAEIREARLVLEKQIASRKEEIKNSLIKAALERLECVSRLRKTCFGRVMDDVVKGKRSIKSIEAALDGAVSNANASIQANRQAILQFTMEYGEQLVTDAEDLETNHLVYVESELRRRLELARAAEERERLAKVAMEARKEAEEAKTELKEQGLPPLPTVRTEERPSGVLTPFDPEPESAQVAKVVKVVKTVNESEEWEEFRSAVFEAFRGLKGARGKLIHAVNKRRVAYFAQAVNEAWRMCAEKGGEI